MRAPATTLGLGLIVLLGGLLLYLLLSGGAEPPPTDEPGLNPIRRPGPEAPEPPAPTPPPVEAIPEAPTPEAGQAEGPAGEATSLVGLRDPEGIDLSDPAQALSYLDRLLAKAPRDWGTIQRVLEVLEVPLGRDLRRALVDGLGDARLGLVQEALVRSSDPELVTDLLLLLDDAATRGKVRVAVLSILGRSPAVEDADIVTQLESRLLGEPRQDVPVLRAIAARGGKEAARAVVDYLEQAKDPLRLPRRSGLGLDLTKDEEAAAIFEDAIRRAKTPALTRVLAEMVATPGADRFVEPLASLDRPGSPPEIQRLALGAIAEIGTEAAVEHLLAAADSRDAAREDAALASIRHMNSADPKARAALMTSLEEADDAGLRLPAKRALLEVLGNLGHRPAAPSLAAALDDPDPATRQLGAAGLGRMGEAGQPYVPKLVEFYRAADPTGKRQVILALGGIGGDEGLGALRKLKADRTLTPALRRAVETALRGR